MTADRTPDLAVQQHHLPDRRLSGNGVLHLHHDGETSDHCTPVYVEEGER